MKYQLGVDIVGFGRKRFVATLSPVVYPIKGRTHDYQAFCVGESSKLRNAYLVVGHNHEGEYVSGWVLESESCQHYFYWKQIKKLWKQIIKAKQSIREKEEKIWEILSKPKGG